MVDFEKSSFPFVNIFQITVEDEIASGDREPIVVLGAIVLNFIVGRDKLIPFLNLIQLVSGALGVVGLNQHPADVYQGNNEERQANVLVELVFLFFYEEGLRFQFLFSYRLSTHLLAEILQFVVELAFEMERHWVGFELFLLGGRVESKGYFK